jgi:hypothetical protein
MRHYGDHGREDLTRCAASISHSSPGTWRGWTEQCKRPRGFGDAGILCKQHAVKANGGLGRVSIPDDIDEAMRAEQFKVQMQESETALREVFVFMLADILNPDKERAFDRAVSQYRNDAVKFRNARELAELDAKMKEAKP